MSGSCVGCKFLYSHGKGYSNYTWEDTDVCCALSMNLNLPASEPYDWKKDPDNWPKTNQSRCSQFKPGPFVELDVDGENGPADFTDDAEQIKEICLHSLRNPKGCDS